LIKNSEGEKQKLINEAAGRASEIEAVAVATASGLREIASAIGSENGMDAVNLRIAEQYLTEFGKLAKENNTILMPANLTDIGNMVATATTVFKQTTENKK
jgi:regulator of protease activity HflC (stomatin/prohibitin superfamily)